MNEQEIFSAALEQEPQCRAAFLDSACGVDAALRMRLNNLLQCHGQDAAFFEKPAAEILATAQSPSSTETTGTLIGAYKLLEQIGEGGMGLVYMAEQQQPVRRLVALKIIKPGMDSKQVIARFEAERQALAMMDHPNIAKVHDAGTTETGRPYFVMELVRGIPLNEFCDQKRLTVGDRLQLFVQVCQAVQHAHQKGIIHRDLKPTNVLIAMADTVPFPKIIDFGIAKALGQSLTDSTLHTGYAQLVGTPLYMSPEQAEMNLFGVDTRSDVYSLGVLLYELLTGTTPFDKETLTKASFDEMRRIIREEEPETVSTRLARTRRVGSAHHGSDQLCTSSGGHSPPYNELDCIVMKSLEKDRNRRYESASALAADIQRYLSDEPVLACPPTTMYRFQKFARKHKPALVTATAIAACLILGTTVSAWQAVRATTAEAQATANEQKANANAAKAEEKAQEATAQRDEVKALNERLQRALYASNINLAEKALDAGSIARVNELLDQHQPKPGETDLRGFEWYYLHRLCHSEILSFKGFSGGIPGDRNMAFSPDGKRFAYGSSTWDATGKVSSSEVKVCDAQTGRELLVLRGHSGWVHSVAFSPDGKRMASASGEWATTAKPGEVKVWDAQTGQDLFACKGHTGEVFSVTFSPDGKRLASSSADKTVKLWNAQSGEELFTFKGHTGEGEGFWSGVNAVAFSPDGQRLASASYQEFKVWDAQTGRDVFTLKGGGASFCFSPDGRRLAGVARDPMTRQQAVKVWDAQTGQDLLSLEKSTLQVNSVAFSPDGTRLASASGAPSRPGAVKVWDAQTGRELFSFKGHNGGAITSVVFNPDGTRLASGDLGTIKIWDATTTQEAHTFSEHGGPVTSLAFKPDGRQLASAGVGGVKVWNTQSRQELFALKGHAGPARQVVFSPNGKRLASASDDKTIKVWDADSGNELFTIKGHTAAVASVAFNPDGTRLASCSRSVTSGASRNPVEPSEVKIWDGRSGTELLTLKGHGRVINSVAYSPDGKRLAGAGSGDLKVWDAETGQELLSLKGVARTVVFSPDGKHLAGTGSTVWQDTRLGEAKVWDALTGQELLTLKGLSPGASSVVYTPDGNRLVSGIEGDVKFWDAQSGQELFTLTVKGHEHRISNLSFSPDGKRLATSGPSGAVKIFDATPLPEKP